MRSSKKASKYVLTSLSKESLRRLSERLDLPSYGNINAIVDRILKAHEGDHRDLIGLLRSADLREILRALEDDGMVSGQVSGTVGQMASRLKRIITRRFSVDEGRRVSDVDLHGRGISALTALFSKEALASAAERLEISGKGTAGAIVERMTWFYAPYFLTVMKSFSLRNLKGAARSLAMSPSDGRDELALLICRQLGLDAFEIDPRKSRVRQTGKTETGGDGGYSAKRTASDGEAGDNESGVDGLPGEDDEEIDARGVPDPDFACFGAYKETADACADCEVKNDCADEAVKTKGVFGDAEQILSSAKGIEPEEIIKARKIFDYETDEDIRLDELNRKYKELQLTWHPDHVGDKPIEFVSKFVEMSKLINEMYEVLKKVAS
jgi:hypothetical protein